jgi:hypothetical protein
MYCIRGIGLGCLPGSIFPCASLGAITLKLTLAVEKSACFMVYYPSFELSISTNVADLPLRERYVVLQPGSSNISSQESLNRLRYITFLLK